MKPFWQRRSGLSVLDDCILWGSRVYIPRQGRQLVLRELHDGHPGSSQMKALARMYVWWFSMDKDIDQLVHECEVCQQVKPMQPKVPLHPWSWPARPWARVHVDLAGPMQGRMFLILIDAHSKWLEVCQMSSTSSGATIQHLRAIFSRFGLPETLVSDNGPQFSSEEFKSFCQANGTVFTTLSLPYTTHHQMGWRNGQFRHLNKALRNLRKEQWNSDFADYCLTTYLLPIVRSTGKSPAELMLGRQPRSRLDLLKPDLEKTVRNKMSKRGHTTRLL